MTEMDPIDDVDADAPTLDIEDRPANAADPEAISLQRERAKRIQNRTVAFWSALLATKESRAEVWRILEMGGVFRTPFASANGFPDVNATFFAAGKHAMAQSLYHEAMASDIDGVREMLKENDSGFAGLAPELKRRGARA